MVRCSRFNSEDVSFQELLFKISFFFFFFIKKNIKFL